ncbi:flagellar cap protein FliD N-terminal domain-containing protein [Pseudarthrobacter sp. L19]|uniref:flagellar cap protein FliD N-terminal domain-containing protein n=1 Tax=Pseudarthrobacter sp. L19 TaxID=3423951 RepID=UPI003D7B4188
MTLEAVPQTQLKSRVADVQSSISAFQGLNASVADLASKAAKVALPNALDLYAATSSSSAVTATTTTGTSAGSLDFTVDKVAFAQVSVSQPMTAWPYSTVTITTGGRRSPSPPPARHWTTSSPRSTRPASASLPARSRWAGAVPAAIYGRSHRRGGSLLH